MQLAVAFGVAFSWSLATAWGSPPPPETGATSRVTVYQDDDATTVVTTAVRKRAPQVVNNVAGDPDYVPDVAGTRSEMAIPLLDSGIALGALDFQSDQADAFDLDAVAAAEILAEFLVVALGNARRFAEERQPRPDSN